MPGLSSPVFSLGLFSMVGWFGKLQTTSNSNVPHSHKHYCLYPPHSLIPRPPFYVANDESWRYERLGTRLPFIPVGLQFPARTVLSPVPRKARSHIYSYLINHSGVGNKVPHSTFLPLPRPYLPPFPNLILSFPFFCGMKSFIRCVCTSLPGLLS